MKKVLYIVICTLVLFCTGCHRAQKPIVLTGEAQGTYYAITYYDSKGRNLQPQIDSILNNFDQSVSLWKENSLLRRINRGETDQLDNTLCTLLHYSMEMNTYTESAFDCTVGKLVRAWGFGFDNRVEMTDKIVDSLLTFTGSNRVAMTDSSDTCRIIMQPGTEIDFNAIGQGYSVDLISDYFQSLGIRNFLVDVGGEVIARGHKPDGAPWSVGIEHPSANKYSTPEVENAIALQDLSVVTSGNYRKYYEKDGVKYSHTIDPATGKPVAHSLLSVSVVDQYAWRADALATAFMVMGLERTLRFIDNHPNDPQVQSVFLIYDDQGQMKTFATSKFEQLIIKK